METHSARTTRLFTHFASWEKNTLHFPKAVSLNCPQCSFMCVVYSQNKMVHTREYRYTCDAVYMMAHVGKSKMWLCVTHWCSRSNLALLHVKMFPTLWHSTGLGPNREARCAPRMRVCRVPISEYTVIGLPEDPYLTFRLQVAGHFSAQPSSASAINPFVAQPSQHNRKTYSPWKNSMLI